MSDDIVVNIAFKGNANEFLAELSRSVGKAKQQLQEMGQSTAALSRLETQLAKMSTAANQAAQATARAAQATQGWAQKWTPFKGAFQQAEASSKALWRSIDTGLAQSSASIGRATTMLAQFNAQQQAGARTAAIKSPMADWDRQFAALSRAADDNVKAMQRARAAVEQYQNSLSNTRYVLYDVAGTLSILGIGLVAPIAAIVTTAVQFEKAFAQVERTSGATGYALQALKKDFDELYGSIPITYDALAKIATLGGQLGVPLEDLKDFTEVVAQTSAVTNLTVEQAATAFGRLNALIPNVKGQYDKLGSSIALVGVNSVATESDIVNVSTQISSMGTFSGMTAQDIIGLSGALASVGAPPELSRGTITRTFALMSAAVSTGGKDLENFARVAGVSSGQFAQAWGTPAFTNVFLGFMKGIHGEGRNAISTLSQLGITSSRDVPLLLRLAGAADSTGQAAGLLSQTIGDANKGWTENIELQRQYAIISATVAAKFEILTNNFNLLLQAIGAPMIGSLGDIIDLLTDITKNATDFVSTDLGGTIVRIGIVLTTLIGVLAIATGAMALMGASSIGVYQALLFLAAQSPITARALVGVSGAAGLAGGTLKAGAASALLFTRALKLLSLVGLALVLPDLLTMGGNAIADQVDKVTGVTRDWSSALKRLSQDTGFLGMSGFDVQSNPITNFLLTVPWDSMTRDVSLLNKELLRLANGGDYQSVAAGLTEISKASGQSLSELLGGNSDLEKVLFDAGIKLEEVGGKIRVVGEASTSAIPGADGFATSVEGIAAEAEAALAILDEMKDALDSIGGSQMSAAAASDAMWTAINKATAGLKDQDVTLDGTNDASIAYRDTMRDIETSARDAAYAMAENGSSIEEVSAKYFTGRDAIIGLLVARGLDATAAAAWADANLGASSEVITQLSGVTQAVEGIPKNPVINVTANTQTAKDKLDSLIYAYNGQAITLFASVGIRTPSILAPIKALDKPTRANGGPVFGPGTSTSDSIEALLSDGEYVLRTRAAKAIGYGRLNYMNQTGRLPAFATGGQVGTASQSASDGFQMGEIDLGPRTMRALSRQVVNMINIDQDTIADAASVGNSRSAWRGGRRRG